jgi:hypothetical protein
MTKAKSDVTPIRDASVWASIGGSFMDVIKIAGLTTAGHLFVLLGLL